MKAPSPPQPIRVVLVEDHRMFREWLGQMLAQGNAFTICGEADNNADAIAVIRRTKPDIAIVDLTLRGSSGLELIKDLKAQGINVPVLVLSMHDDELYAERVVRAGARGYISKHEATSALTEAISTILRGDVFLSGKITAQLLKRMSGGASAKFAGLEPPGRPRARGLPVDRPRLQFAQDRRPAPPRGEHRRDVPRPDQREARPEERGGALRACLAVDQRSEVKWRKKCPEASAPFVVMMKPKTTRL